jgi:Mce-associated membrane protein
MTGPDEQPRVDGDTAGPAAGPGPTPQPPETDTTPAAPDAPPVGGAPAHSADVAQPASPTAVEPVAAEPVVTEPVTEPVASEPAAEPASGPAAVETDDDLRPSGTSARSLAGLLPVVALAVVAVLIALTAFLAWKVWQDRRTDQARTEALAVSRDAARLLFSYDHSSLDEDFQAGLDVATGDFREEYERTTRDVVRPVAEQYDAVVEAEVAEAGVVSARPDRVVTIVFVNQTTTSTRVDGPKLDQSRVRMTLTRDGDRWLVERVDAL